MPDSDEARGIILVRVDTVERQEIRWIWQGRIPLGKLTVLAGDPGLGKSFLTLAMIATVTRGAPWPDAPEHPTEPGTCVLLSAEDDLADTIRPRLEAAGAYFDKIHVLTTVRQADGTMTSFSLKIDLARLEEAIERLGDVRLVVIDPVTAYLGATDDHKNAEVRAILGPLADLASRCQVAVVLVTHLNKSGGGKALYRFTGSLAYIAAARAGWLVVKDRDNPRRRLLLPSKNNLAPDSTGLAYQIVDGAIQWEGEPVSVSADEALAGEGKPADTYVSDIDKAAKWLKEFLDDGPKPSEEATSKGNKALSLSKSFKWWRDSVLKFKLGGRSSKLGFKGGWAWTLPNGHPHEESEESQESEDSKNLVGEERRILGDHGISDFEESTPTPPPSDWDSSDSSYSWDSSDARGKAMLELIALPLVEVMARYLGPPPGRRGDRSGRSWWHCAFHDDANPSLCAEPGGTRFHCFGCGARGDAIDFVRKVDPSLTFREARAIVCGETPPRRAPAPTRQEVRKEPAPRSDGWQDFARGVVERAEAALWSDRGERARSYLDGRGLADETIRAARLGVLQEDTYVDGVFPDKPTWVPAGITIPWFEECDVAMVNIRRPAGSVPKYWAIRGSRRGIYPSKFIIATGRPLLLAEGEFEALLLNQELAGLAPAITLGSASDGRRPAVLSAMLGASPWFVAGDSDAAGKTSAEAWLALSGRCSPPRHGRTGPRRSRAA